MRLLSQTSPENLHVLLRLDLDLPQNNEGEFDLTRLELGLPTLEYLWQAKAQAVTVIAHRGHTVEPSAEFSLKPIAELLYDTLAARPAFSGSETQLRSWLTVRENLRFDPREEQADLDFAKELAQGHDLFVNDAFATAHREHTSIVTLPTVLPTFFGLQFEKEIKAFEKVFNNPAHPVLFILGGSKIESKLPLLEQMAKVVDQILVGGKLAVEAKQGQVSFSDLLTQKMQIAEVTEDSFDISADATATFIAAIAQAQTIVWNGPMGRFEDGAHTAGTRAIGQAIAQATQAGAFSLIGGGDTEAALSVLELEQPGNFSHISSGGGAMMHYLAHQTLPALAAVT